MNFKISALQKHYAALTVNLFKLSKNKTTLEQFLFAHKNCDLDCIEQIKQDINNIDAILKRHNLSKGFLHICLSGVIHSMQELNSDKMHSIFTKVTLFDTFFVENRYYDIATGEVILDLSTSIN